MKKIILSLAIAAMAFVPAVATAQNNQKEAPTRNAVKPGLPGARPGVQKELKQFEIFQNIDLDDTQRSQVDALNKALVESRRELMKSAQKMIQKNDSTAKADRKEMKKDMSQDMKEINRKYLADLKKILSDSQYTQFLEESFVDNASKVGKGPKSSKGALKGRPGKFADKKAGLGKQVRDMKSKPAKSLEMKKK